MKDYFEIGQIVNTYGIKGFVKVNPFTDDITRFEKLKTVYIDIKGNLKEFTIEEVKYSKNMVLLKFKEIPDINEAERYRNYYIKISRDKARKLPKDTYYIADLIGLEVYNENSNELLGKVDDIFSTGSNDVYVVKDELGKQILLPGTKEVIKEVDLENGKIFVNLIKGLI